MVRAIASGALSITGFLLIIRKSTSSSSILIRSPSRYTSLDCSNSTFRYNLLRIRWSTTQIPQRGRPQSHRDASGQRRKSGCAIFVRTFWLGFSFWLVSAAFIITVLGIVGSGVSYYSYPETPEDPNINNPPPAGPYYATMGGGSGM